MAKTLHSQCRDLGSVPGWGNDIRYALKTQHSQINNSRKKKRRRLRDIERLIKYLPKVRQLEEVGLNFKTRSVCLSESKLCLKHNITLPDAMYAGEKVVKNDVLY